MTEHPTFGRRVRLGIAAVAAPVLTLTGLGVAPAQAQAPSDFLPSKFVPSAACAAGAATTTLTVLDFNDFHGRITTAPKLFTAVEQTRQAQGEGNVLLVSSGDNIGGSTFESASQDDKPTLDVLNAAALDASAVGNHEFDKGWSDLSGRVDQAADFPWLGANVYDAGTTTVAAPLKPYQIFDKAGLKVAVVGVVTKDLPSLVSPDGISTLTIGDPVQAVNRVAAQLKDGNAANGEADIVIAALHEGAPDGTLSPAQNAADSPAFASIHSQISSNVSLVFNAHTHQTYNWTTSATGVPLLQAGSYGEQLAKVTLTVDTTAKTVCQTTPELLPTSGITADTSLPRVAAIKTIVDKAVAQAEVVGAEVIGTASAPISLPGGLYKPDVRNAESPASNLVAQMFHDVLGNGNPEFIGVQNPGGTRAGFDAGDITYKEAALTLPFANTLMTTQLTGAQVITMLEQQWQRDKDGNVPSRPYLRLGLSSNVSYTYDESRAEGSRITSVTINGAPLQLTKLYTVGSGSFLIAGGDNFHVFTQASAKAARKDSGQVDLTAMVDWVKATKTLSPTFAMTGVSLRGAPTTLTEGTSHTLQVGVPIANAAAPDTLDSTGAAAVKNTTLQAFVRQGGVEVAVGQASVSNGQASLTISLPLRSGLTAGAATLVLKASPAGTVAQWPLNLATAARPSTWGDQNGDGYGDILAVDPDGVLKLFFGRAGGLTGTSMTVGGGWDAFTWFSHTPDVNGDGIDDMIGRRKDGNLYLYLGQGLGSYTAPRLVGTGWGGLTNLTVVGDMNNDGRIELVGVGADKSLLRYTITPTAVTGAAKIGQNWGNIKYLTSVGTFNADTTADLIAVGHDGNLYAYLTGSQGTIVRAAQIGRGWTGFTAMFSPGDLSGDGRPDLVGRNAAGVLYAYTNRLGSWSTAIKIGTGFGEYVMFG